MWAALNGHHEIVHILVEANAGVDIQEKVIQFHINALVCPVIEIMEFSYSQ